MKKYIRRAVAPILVVLLVAGGYLWYDKFTVEPPNYPPLGKVVWLDQNWTPEQRDWFHHADQGTQTFGIPYEWFMALEQPPISSTGSGLLSDPTYLDRYGFIPDTARTGKSEMPIGFAQGGPMSDASGAPWRNPQTSSDMTAMGLTCAACHTGRFTYQNTTVLIDGSPALTNLDEFQKGVAMALLYTWYLPPRFNRFADRVLGPGASAQAKSELRKQFKPVVAQVEKIIGLEFNSRCQSTTEGFARLDALNRIGDVAFALDLNEPANWVGFSAPVHFPRIWQASWFEWVQYNGSIEQPMTRNAGEALGVGAAVQLTGAKSNLFASSVRPEELFKIEQLLAGTPPPDATTGFSGLRSPKWPANILPPINTDLAARGAVLYKEVCQGCHLAPITDAEFWASKEWSQPNSANERFLDLDQIDVMHIGTDPSEAADMRNRRVATPPNLGITSSEFGVALGQLVDLTLAHWYDSQQPPISAAMREQMNGNRPSNVRAPLSYKVRPLNGVWATPPYLHNGSVPNVYALLSPVVERPKKFYLGNREYDPVNLGYVTGAFPGGFEFDTSIRGNLNTGHEFSDDRSKEGVIGRALSPDERRALIEYLKTL
jgi:processive rubber oxygenase RoxA-like protein